MTQIEGLAHINDNLPQNEMECESLWNGDDEDQL